MGVGLQAFNGRKKRLWISGILQASG